MGIKIDGVKRMSRRLVCGPHGPCVERGYTEIGGVRLYDEVLVVGPYGQPMIDPGYTELVDHPRNHTKSWPGVRYE